MKSVRVFSVLAIVLAYFSVSAQDNWRKLSEFTSTSTLGFNIDFSEAIIDALEIDEFIAMEPNWEQGVKEIEKRFLYAFNKEAYAGNYPHRITNKDGANYKLNLKILNITTSHLSKKKTTMTAVVTITDNTGKVRFTKNIDERTGLFGTKINLISDVVAAAGESLGEAFYSYSRPR